MSFQKVLFSKKRKSKNLIVSFPKSGRTWLRMMINKSMVDEFSLKGADLLETYQITNKLSNVPNTHLIHDGSPHLKNWDRIEQVKSRYRRKRVLFLVRDPRDIVVSNYFQSTKRSFDQRNNIFEDCTIQEFLSLDIGSLKSVVSYYNSWSRNRNTAKDFMLIRYEDLIDDTTYTLQRVLDYLHIPVSHKTIVDAVNYSSFNNMKSMEKSDIFGQRLKAGNPKDNESYKVRRGKVGGYVDYFNKEDLDYMNAYIQSNLDDYYYYYK